MSCKRIEGKLIAFMDGRASDADRRAVESHLAECAACKARVEGFSGVWSMLNEMPVVEPSHGFEARLRARMAAEPQRVSFWQHIAAMLPSPRLALAVAMLGLFSLWQSSRPVAVNETATPVSSDAEFRMIQDLPVLENYDVLTSLDALSQPIGQGQCYAGEEIKREEFTFARSIWNDALWVPLELLGAEVIRVMREMKSPPPIRVCARLVAGGVRAGISCRSAEGRQEHAPPPPPPQNNKNNNSGPNPRNQPNNANVRPNNTNNPNVKPPNIRQMATLPPKFIEKLHDMSPEQQERFLQNNERFRNMNPQQQARIRQNLQQWNTMTPQQRIQWREQQQAFESMTPVEQQYVRQQLLPNLAQMLPTQRQFLAATRTSTGRIERSGSRNEIARSGFSART